MYMEYLKLGYTIYNIRYIIYNNIEDYEFSLTSIMMGSFIRLIKT